jgi:hypothetical protein
MNSFKGNWLRNWLTRYRFHRIYGLHHGILSIRDDGLELRKYRLHKSEITLDSCWTICWNEITKIVAFKRDCYAVDLICIVFELGGASSVETDEEMEGWQGMMNTLATRFGIREEAWFRKVAVPAFATNMTTLWNRKENPGRPAESESNGGT